MHTFFFIHFSFKMPDIQNFKTTDLWCYLWTEKTGKVAKSQTQLSDWGCNVQSEEAQK